MDRIRLLKQLERAWGTVKESYAKLSEKQMTQPGVAGDWSVKDTLAHITTWEEEALKYLPLILNGKRPPRYSVQYGGINAFNAQTVRKKRALTLQEVLTELDAVHERLIAFINSVNEKEFETETRFRRRLRLDTYSHYPKHVEAIRKWRLQNGERLSV